MASEVGLEAASGESRRLDAKLRRVRKGQIMKTPGLSLCALFACSVMLAACSEAPGLSRLQYAPSIVPNHKASPLSVYYISL